MRLETSNRQNVKASILGVFGRRQVTTVAAATLALGLCTAAHAQHGEAAGIAEMMNPEYLKRDIVLFDQSLNLDSAQRVIVDVLFHDYEQAFQEGKAAMHKSLQVKAEEAREVPEADILKHVLTPLDDWQKQRLRVGEQFLENVQMILNADQMELWPAFERRLLREKYLHQGQFSGESTNLFDIVREMNLDEVAMRTVKPILDQYDVDIDQALRRRREATSGDTSKWLRSMAEQNPQSGLELMRKQIERRVAVRNVNDEYIERITQALGDDTGARFRNRAMERGYPQAYRPTAVERLFTAAKELSDLDSTALEQVRQIEAEYKAQLVTINEEIVREIRRFDPIEARERAELFSMRMGGKQFERSPNPTRNMQEQRDEIGRDAAKRLQGALTAEQFALLPGAHRFAESPEHRPEDGMTPDARRSEGKPVRESVRELKRKGER